jgi:hypothetical protein
MFYLSLSAFKLSCEVKDIAASEASSEIFVPNKHNADFQQLSNCWSSSAKYRQILF